MIHHGKYNRWYFFLHKYGKYHNYQDSSVYQTIQVSHEAIA